MHVSTGGDDITVTINDYINKESTSYQITDINNNIKINELINKIKKLKNYNYDNSSLVLYFAKVECKLNEQLSTYNKSNRKTIKLELYVSSMITINVRTLQSCGSGTSRCIPLWSFCCRQTIKIRIVDTSEVRVLKQRIYSATDDDISIPVDNIVLLYKGAPLNNFLTLKESELVDNCYVDYFVPLCYIYKEKKDQTKEEDNDDEKELGIYKDKKPMKKIESTKVEEKDTKTEEIKKAPTTEVKKTPAPEEIKKAPTTEVRTAPAAEQIKRPPTTEVRRAPATEEIKRPPTTEVRRPPATEEIKRPPTTEARRTPTAAETNRERAPNNNMNAGRPNNKNRRGRRQP
ncbi:conserved protein, unknown function [Plasmodium chabaudi chabaudi]|uniref:Ubiquitin-like domain-containing protein n=1 Tax=Plasmodium chabaudi chabaudi TaxID=31271 RepID=A0A4V0K551_PLACU|nr:conserved protein, unknown function [Plasmodium chabaudi chabaudi]VTZ68073.1 conserved protein, unknown function [Plasmodium chabaudi chabaudi]|eukprot:XP_745058.2 conserved Plasmodium protein, unknown function [Plasmodium chabaudi chabaudi]